MWWSEAEIDVAVSGVGRNKAREAVSEVAVENTGEHAASIARLIPSGVNTREEHTDAACQATRNQNMEGRGLAILGFEGNGNEGIVGAR
jgi:hypothetical protein